MFDADGTPLDRYPTPALGSVVDLFATKAHALGVVDADAKEVLLVAADGRIVRRVALPVRPAACAYRTSHGREQLLVADADAARLLLLDLPDLYDVAAATKVVEEFLGALAAADVQRAARSADGLAKTKLDDTARDLANAQANAAAITELRLTVAGRETMVLEGIVPAASGPQPTEFHLRRSSVDGAFRIVRY